MVELPDLPQLNEIAPKHPKLNGNDGLQIAHIQGTAYWNNNFGPLLTAIDPDDLLSQSALYNVVHAPETKPGGMALGT